MTAPGARVPWFIPLVQEAPQLFSLAGTLRPPQRTIGVEVVNQISLRQLDRLYVDSLGVERGVYKIVAFATSLTEAYPWLTGDEKAGV